MNRRSVLTSLTGLLGACGLMGMARPPRESRSEPEPQRPVHKFSLAELRQRLIHSPNYFNGSLRHLTEVWLDGDDLCLRVIPRFLTLGTTCIESYRTRLERDRLRELCHEEQGTAQSAAERSYQAMRMFGFGSSDPPRLAEHVACVNQSWEYFLKTVPTRQT